MKRIMLWLLAIVLTPFMVSADPNLFFDKCGIDLDVGIIDIDLRDPNCGIPKGEFEVLSLRNRYFLKTTEINGQVLPLCRLDGKGVRVPYTGNAVPAGYNAITWQSDVRYNSAFAGYDPQTGQPLITNACDLDYGIANWFDLRSAVVFTIDSILTWLGLIAIGLIIYAGFLYLFSGGDDGKVSTARNIILYTVIGIIIILMAYAIVATVLRIFQTQPTNYNNTNTGTALVGQQLNADIGILNKDGSTPQQLEGGYYVSLEEASNGVFATLQGTAQFSSATWTFGDSTTERRPNLQNPETEFSLDMVEHSYGREGVYAIVFNGTTTDSPSVQVNGQTRLWVGGVNAALSVSDDSVFVDQPVTFRGNQSTTPVGSILTYTWSCFGETTDVSDPGAGYCQADFADVTTPDVEGVTFSVPGTYTIQLEVETTFGGRAVTTKTITVVDKDIEAIIVKPLQKSQNASRPTEYILDGTPSRNIQNQGGSLRYTWGIYNENLLVDTVVSQTPRTWYEFPYTSDPVFEVFLLVSQEWDGEVLYSEFDGGNVQTTMPDTAPGGCENFLYCDRIELAGTSNLSLSINGTPPFALGTPETLTTMIHTFQTDAQMESYEWGIFRNDGSGVTYPGNDAFLNPSYTPPQGANGGTIVGSGTTASVVIDQPGTYIAAVRAEDILGNRAVAVYLLTVASNGQPLAVPQLFVDAQNIQPFFPTITVTRDQVATIESNLSLDTLGEQIGNAPDTVDVVWQLNNVSVLNTTGSLDPDMPVNDVLALGPDSPLGLRSLNLIIVDTNDANKRDSAQVQFNVVNKAPEFQIGNEVNLVLNNDAEGNPESIAVLARATDPDTIGAGDAIGKIVSWRYELFDNGVLRDVQVLQGAASNATEFSISQYPGVHTYRVKVTVTDSDGAQASYTTGADSQIVIDNPIINLPPNLFATVTDNTGDTDTDFFFQANVSDPEADFVDLQWNFDCASESSPLTDGGAYPNDLHPPLTNQRNPRVRYVYDESVSYPVEVLVCAVATDGVEADDRPVVESFTVFIAEGDGFGPGGAPVENVSPEVLITTVTPIDINNEGILTSPQGTRYTFYGSVSDPNFGDTHDLRWTITGPETLNKVVLNPQLVYIFDTPGEYTVTLFATENNTEDAFEGSAETTVIITEQDIAENQPPVGQITAVAPSTAVQAGTQVFAYGTGYDPDFGDTITYQWTLDGTPLGIQTAVSHVFDTVGTYVIALIVTDDQGLESEPVNVTITVTENPEANPVNNAPDVAILSYTPSQGGTTANLWAFYGFASDVDGDSLTYEWDMGDGTTLTTLTPNVTHIYADAGSYTVTVTANDNSPLGALSDSDSVTIEVVETEIGSPADNPPEVMITAVTPSELTADGPQGVSHVGGTVQLWGKGVDPDLGDKIQYEWDMGDGETRFTFVPAVNYVYAAEGTYVVTLTGTDLAGNTDSDSITVVVTAHPGGATPSDPADNAPTANITAVTPADPTDFAAGYALTTQVVRAFGAGADADFGDVLTYSWDFGDGFTVQNGPAAASHQYAAAGDYTLTLTVTDASGQTATDTAQVTIVDPAQTQPSDNAPTGRITAITPQKPGTLDPHGLGAVGQGFQFFGAGEDADFTDTLTYAWDFGDGATFEALTAGAAHAYDAAGDYTIRLTITDEAGQSATDTATVTVLDQATDNPAQNAPEAQITAVTPNLFNDPNVAGAGITGQLFQFFGRGIDADFGDTLTYNWDFGDGADQDVINPAATHLYAEPGTYTVTLTATDASGQTATDTAQVLVVDPDNFTPPGEGVGSLQVQIREVLPSDTIIVGEGLQVFSFTAGQPVGPVSYDWDMGDGAHYNTPGVAHLYATPGEYTITVTATDGANEATDEYVITVLDDPVRPNNPPSVQISAIVPRTTVAVGSVVGLYSAAIDLDADALTYVWDMGDGTQYEYPSVSHIYDSTGEYAVTLTVSDGQSDAVATQTITVVAPDDVPNAEPQAVISAVVPAERVTYLGNAFQFFSQVSDLDGQALTYAWDMGDGTTYTNPAVNHIYGQAGTYTITLTATDGIANATDTTTVQVVPPGEPLPVTPPSIPGMPDPGTGAGDTTGNNPPAAKINTVTPGPSGTTDTLFAFYGSGVDIDGDALTYKWTFPGGTQYTAPAVWHQFYVPGSYTIELEVSDGEASSTDSIDIVVLAGDVVVTPDPNNPGFGYDPDGNLVPLPTPDMPNPGDVLNPGAGVGDDDAGIRAPGADDDTQNAKKALQNERDRLMLDLGLTTDPIQRAAIQAQIKDIDDRVRELGVAGLNSEENQAIIDGLVTGYVNQLETEREQILAQLATETDPALREQLLARAQAINAELDAIDTNPNLALVALGISLTDGIVPYVTIKGIENKTRFFLYGTAPTEAGVPLLFTWDLGDGRTVSGQNVLGVSYARAGYYRVVYSITDGVQTARDTVIVKVEVE